MQRCGGLSANDDSVDASLSEEWGTFANLRSTNIDSPHFLSCVKLSSDEVTSIEQASVTPVKGDSS